MDRISHATFYERELEAMEAEKRTYYYSEAQALREQKRLFVGIFHGIDEKRGNIILKFRIGFTPRLKVMNLAFTVPLELSRPNQWGELTYLAIRKQAILGSDVLPIFYLNSNEPEFSLMGFSNAEVSFVEKLKIGMLVVVAEGEPPFEYLRNLKKIVEETSSNVEAGRILDIKTDSKVWNPMPLFGDESFLKVIKTLENKDEVIIQGPPGTGKTFLMAQLCDHFLRQQKSVFVSALTNKALSELAEKPQLKVWMNLKKVWKTRISLEEKIKMPNLQLAKELNPIKGELHLSTFYLMSKEAIKIENPIFDVVILEEASQSFLATIAACKKLARKLIIVGDPMQLQPIVLQPNPQNIHPDIYSVVNGLKTYAFNSEQASFRLTETYRLTEKATAQTGVFYGNSLVSRSEIVTPIKLKSNYVHLFDAFGGTSIHYMDLVNDGREAASAALFIRALLEDIFSHNPDLKIAVLAPFRMTVKVLEQTLSALVFQNEGLTVETVDRIQGLTCDFTIYLIPFGGTAFGLHENRFNVATSRAKMGTLIITDKIYEREIPSFGVVQRFLDSVIA
jgi:DNA replication ATP-dependent helicase Dna2